MKNYTLGLDLGSNSIGWALLDIKDHDIIDIGVRIFPEEGMAGTVSKGGKQVKVSQRAMRGYTRRARRNRDRKTRRRNKLINILIKNSLLPSESKKREELLLDLDVPKEERTLRPYKLRSKGIDEQDDPLTLYEIGRVIYHLNQRRGYHSNRKSGDPSEDKKVGKEAEILTKRIANENCRTLGEYFYKVIATKEKNKKEEEIERIRQRYTFRESYLNEFNQIWKLQKKYYPNILTEELQKQIQNETIYFQRQTKYPKPKRCEYEPYSYTCKRANWHSRWFVLYQIVNNFKIEEYGIEPKLLCDEKRAILLDLLSKKERVIFKEIKKQLSFNSDILFNYEEGGKAKSIKGDGFLSEIRSVFENKWDNYQENERKKIVNAFAYFDDSSLEIYLKEKYNFTKKQIERALQIPIPEGRMPYSMIAIKKMNIFLKEGRLQHEALYEAYHDNNDKILPIGRIKNVPDIENHVVRKALYELKKVLNAIIKRHGQPKRIHIEMARDINKSVEEKDQIRRTIKAAEEDNEKNWDELKRLIAENKIDVKPGKKTLLKYKLWKEAGEKCVFCGKYIHPSRLFEPNIQIEHILPRSRSYDNSYANKTIAHSTCNQIKDKYTPYEIYKDKPEEYKSLKKNIYQSSMSKQKRNRFIQETLDDQEALNRSINDTRYVNRIAIKTIRQVGCPVAGTKAQFTYTVRELWDLNKILDPYAGIKNRLDNRHHAIDAIAVALIDEKLIEKLKMHFQNPYKNKFELPKEGFWQEAKENIEKIHVSYRSSYTEGHHISGKLHQDNPLGLTQQAKKYFYEGGMRKISKNVWLCSKKLPYIKRKNITESIKKIGDIEEAIPESCKHIKEAIYATLQKENINIRDKTETIPSKILTSIYLIDKEKKKIPVKKIRTIVYESNTAVFTDNNGNPYKAYPTGNNHHMEIVELDDGSREGILVTEFEALRRQAEKKSIINREHNEKKFIMSLAQNDMFMAKVDDDMVLHRVEKISFPDNIILRPHTYGGPCKDTDSKPLVLRKNPRTLEGYKVIIDPTGRIFPAKD